MSITEIAFTGIPVLNMEASRKFYDALLSSKPFFETPDGKLAEYRVGHGILTIGELGEAFKPSSDGTFTALEVDDFKSEIARISDMGARIVVPYVELPSSVLPLCLTRMETRS